MLVEWEGGDRCRLWEGTWGAIAPRVSRTLRMSVPLWGAPDHCGVSALGLARIGAIRNVDEQNPCPTVDWGLALVNFPKESDCP